MLIKSKKLLFALPLISLLFSCQNINSKSVSNSTTPNDDQSNIIVATYSLGEVTLKDANYELNKLIAKNDKLKGLTFDKLSQEQKETIIKEIALREISYTEAKKRKLNKEKDYQETLKNFESELLKQKLLYTIAKEAIDDKNVKKNYDEVVAKLKDKKDLRISYIALKTQNEAEVIYQSLVKLPSSFAFQAKKDRLIKRLVKKVVI